MPFIDAKRREEIRKNGPIACEDLGDICFVFYEQMVKAWKREPRWKTAHRIYRDFFDDDFYNYVRVCLIWKFSHVDVINAADLAWQVFFQNYVMPYEQVKEKENGTI